VGFQTSQPILRLMSFEAFLATKTPELQNMLEKSSEFIETCLQSFAKDLASGKFDRLVKSSRLDTSFIDMNRIIDASQRYLIIFLCAWLISSECCLNNIFF